MKRLHCRPITIKEANSFIKEHHRHHRPTIRNCGRWALAAVDTEQSLIVGVAIAGNPVSATYMDDHTIEITRLCALEGAPRGTCSFLLGKCSVIWRTMGGKKIITYTLDSESGASLRGSGWTIGGTVEPHRRWLNKKNLDGIERSDLEIYRCKKLRWEKLLWEVRA